MWCVSLQPGDAGLAHTDMGVCCAGDLLPSLSSRLASDSVLQAWLSALGYRRNPVTQVVETTAAFESFVALACRAFSVLRERASVLLTLAGLTMVRLPSLCALW